MRLRRCDRRGPVLRTFVSLATFALLAASLATDLSAEPGKTTPPKALDTTWAFTPPRDEFSPDSLLDLRSLNEMQAGETGFVRVGADGGFVRGDGAPVRFWAVNTEVGRSPFVKKPLGPATAPDLARHARFLAKRGVNMVRLHRQLGPDLRTHPGAAIADINTVERDGIWRTVAAMRAEGIYTTLSPYWAGPMKFSAAWGIPGDAAQPAWGLLFFDPMLQAAYKAWLRQLLEPKNPYTGVPLAQDPSVALIQIQNEDSLLFWTVDGIKGAQRAALEMRFGAFLRREHGSLQKAVARWDGDRIDTDILRAGRAPLLPTWELTQPPGTRRATRIADQTEFLTRTMYDFNQMIVRFLRDELGVKQLVNAGNWKTASAERLSDAERWSYTPGDVDAANVYTSGLHEGPHKGWAIVNGDTFTSDSVLRQPWKLPIALKQTAARPMLVTEGTWVMPNAYGAEGPFLVSAYSSLLGIDGYYWFTTSDEGWTAPASANGYLPSQGKWLFGTPEILGSFPAAALAYRMGYLRQGEPVVSEHRALRDLWTRRTPAAIEPTTFDPNRDASDKASTPSRTGIETETDTFLVGPVTVTFGGEPVRAAPLPASRRAPGPIEANTGQIVLDSARGSCIIDAPMVQGVAAHFADRSTHTLSVVQFESTNSFGAAMVVSMDGLPLGRSRRVLIQYATQSRPLGWQQAPTRVGLPSGGAIPEFGIKEIGRAPWHVVSAGLRVTVGNLGLTSATALDMNGMPLRDVPLVQGPRGSTLEMPTGAMYVLLR